MTLIYHYEYDGCTIQSTVPMTQGEVIAGIEADRAREAQQAARTASATPAQLAAAKRLAARWEADPVRLVPVGRARKE